MASTTTELTAKSVSKFDGLVAKYRKDHSHPINHVMHVGIGWPLVAAALLLVPYRPWWSLGLFLSGYAVMFTGHFVFEKNIPTILKHPSTPFVMALSVIKGLWGGAASLIVPSRGR